MPTPTEQKYIVLDSKGRAVIDGTRFKVRELVKNYLANGWSPEELQWNLPTLTLAQVHAALAYYYDHQEAFDREIQEGLQRAEAWRLESLKTPAYHQLRERLEARQRKA